jgi:hypothetical protein
VRFPFLNRVFNTFLFYFGWIVCLQEGSKGQFLYGLLIVLAAVAYYFYSSSCWKADYILLALVVLIGPLSDVLYARLGLLQYHPSTHLFSWIPPLWVFFLWALFGVNIQLFSWLGHHRLLAVLLGALSGPLSYFSVVRLGGASLLMPMSLVFLAIGLVWAIFLPSFVWLNDFLKNSFKDNS